MLDLSQNYSSNNFYSYIRKQIITTKRGPSLIVYFIPLEQVDKAKAGEETMHLSARMFDLRI